MANSKSDVKEIIRDLKEELLLVQKIDCTKEENKIYREMLKRGEPLPEGVYKYEDSIGNDDLGFYTLYIPEMSSEETKEYILLKQYTELRTIKRCMIFFTVLTVISIVLSLFAFLQ